MLEIDLIARNTLRAARSPIATACFNKLAAERGLAARATFRGVDPQDALSVRAVEGLRTTGATSRCATRS